MVTGLALLLHLQLGLTRIANFGVVGFWGLGMYVFGVLYVQVDWPFGDPWQFLVCAALASLVAGLAGVVVGWLISDLDTDGVLVVTLGLRDGGPDPGHHRGCRGPAAHGDWAGCASPSTSARSRRMSSAGCWSWSGSWPSSSSTRARSTARPTVGCSSPPAAMRRSPAAWASRPIAPSSGCSPSRRRAWVSSAPCPGPCCATWTSATSAWASRWRPSWASCWAARRASGVRSSASILTVGLFDIVVRSYLPLPREWYTQAIPTLREAAFGLTLIIVLLFRPSGLLGDMRRDRLMRKLHGK